MNIKPKFHKVFLTDYVTFMTLASSMIALAFSVYFYLFTEESTNMVAIFVGIAIMSLILFFYRLNYVKKVLSTGIECEAVIRKIWFYRDRGRINFTYSYGGIVYTTGNPIMKNKSTKALQNGMPIKVMINKKNLKKAIIKDLYY